MSDNDSRRAIAQQSPEAKERLRELRRKIEKLMNLYLGVRVRVVHKTLSFFYFILFYLFIYYYYRSVWFFESVSDLRFNFCTAPTSELWFPSVHWPQLHRSASAAMRYCRHRSVGSASVGLCTLLTTIGSLQLEVDEINLGGDGKMTTLSWRVCTRLTVMT